LLAAGAIAVWITRHPSEERVESASTTPEAPPDLAKLRGQFTAGVNALQRGDADAAVQQLTSFTFGRRAVEEYRLYFLANAHQLRGDMVRARRTLAELWRRSPRMIYRDDVAFNIGSLYAAGGSWHEASDVYGTLAASAPQSAIAAEARWNYVEARLNAGDPIAAFAAARRIMLENPKSRRAGDAIALLRAFSSVPTTGALPLAIDERITRAEHLLLDGDPQSAFNEIAALDANALGSPLRQRILLTRGLALQNMRRYADSESALAPLLKDQYRFAFPAIRASARNNQVLGASIIPISY
jgi:thioredoxin-like negative regulator of GroEL